MAGTAGTFRHEALVHSGPQELLDVAVPFLSEGLQRGEPAALLCAMESSLAINEALGDPDDVVFLATDDRQSPAPTALSWWRRFMDGYVHRHVPRVRMLSEVPPAATPHMWRQQARLEAVCNEGLAGYPLWTLCAYDDQRLCQDALVSATRTHPLLRLGHQGVPNPAFASPEEYLTALDEQALAPLESAADLELEVSAVREARQDVAQLLLELQYDRVLSPERADGFVLAVGEVLTNAVLHGTPPVTLRLWRSPSQVRCTVLDRGPGVADPLAGYLLDGPEGAKGLVVARQTCDELVMRRTPEGFAVSVVLQP